MMKKYVFLFVAILFCSYNSFAQKKSSSSYNKNMAIGVRLGDPTGVTFKKYLDNDFALEFNAGFPTYAFGGYNHGSYYSYRYKNRRGRGPYYATSYTGGFGYALQGHFTKLFDIKPVDGLQWYVGGGLQFRQRIFEYTYYYYDDFGRYVQDSDRVVDTDFGIDAVGGAEYTFKGLPFSVFADVTFFVEVVDRPWFYVQPGVGGRYNF